MATYRADFEKRGGFIFDAESIVDLCKLIYKFANEAPAVTIEMEGDHNVEGVVRDVLGDLYLKSKNIKGITMRANHYEGGNSCEVNVRLSTSLFAEPVSVTVRGPKDESLHTRGEIEALIEGRKQWYSFFALPPHWLLSVLVYVIIGSLALVLPLLIHGVTKRSEPMGTRLF